MRRLLALFLLLGLSLAQVRFLPAPGLEGAPGAYLTFSLRVEGEGEARFRLEAPAGWQVLSPERVALLEGKAATLSYTLRVPSLPAGTEGKAVVRAFQGEEEVARTEVVLRVLARTEIALAAPANLQAEPDGPFDFHVYVTNRSNRAEEILLEAEAAMAQVRLEPASLHLAPGETQAVRVLVQTEGRLSTGYRFYLKLRATPKGQAAARKEAGVIVLFRDPLAARGQGKDPELTLGLGLALNLGASLENGVLQGSLGYRIAPSLSGALSDHVSASATPSPLSGDLQDPLRLPQSLTLSLKGEGWEARAQGGRERLGLAGSFRLEPVRLSAEGSYQGAALSLRASAVSLDPALDLQGSLGTQVGNAGRQEALSLRYRRPLEAGLSLGLGADLTGQQGEGYALTLGLQQSLTWQSQALELVQSYAGLPFAGLHTLGLAGGTRSLYPLGLRGSTSLALGTDGLWQNRLTLYYQPAAGAFLRLTGSYRQQGGSRGYGLAPGLSVSFGEPGLYTGSLGLGYGLERTLAGDFPERDRYEGTLSLRAGAFGLTGNLRYVRQATPLLEGSLTLQQALPGGSLEGRYQVKRGTDQDLTLYGASWNWIWTGDLQSRLFYEYRVEEATTQRLGLALYRRNFLEPGLALGASYTLAFQEGGLRHGFGLTLAYAQALTFTTPKEVVDLFGGRKGGEVVGQAFRDANLNGRLDPGEAPLAGLRVCMGSACETTDAEGHYRLLAPAGEGRLRFPNLPATLALVGEETLEVRLNARQEKPLPFAPATSLTVAVEDTGTGAGLAYAGVCAQGPVTRCTRADVDGKAVLGGLFAGKYRIYPDARFLPEGYREAEAREVQVALTGNPGPVRIAVSPPRREVEVTYTAGRLSLVAATDPSTPLSGAEVEVKALVQGKAKEVWLELPTGPVPLLPREGNLYAARLRLFLPPGFHTLTVRAQGEEEAEAPLFLQVVAGPLYSPEALEGPKVRLALRFRAKEVALRGETRSFALKSEDGYTWTGEVALSPGRHTLWVLADGETLGPVDLSLLSESASQ